MTFILKKILNYFYQRKIPQVLESLDSWIQPGDTVLDLGSGNGHIAESIKKNKQADVTLLDVVDINETELPLVLYEGDTIPFQDNSFKAILLSFVLHHCEDPTKVLKEACRVSKDKVIIFEDTYKSKAGRVVTCMNDYAANLPSFFMRSAGGSMNMPFNFMKVKEWEELFEQLGLEVVHSQEVSFFPTKKKVLLVGRKRSLT